MLRRAYKRKKSSNKPPWDFLVVQWSRLYALTAGRPGLNLPGRGTNILHDTTWPKSKTNDAPTFTLTHACPLIPWQWGCLFLSEILSQHPYNVPEGPLPIQTRTQKPLSALTPGGAWLLLGYGSLSWNLASSEPCDKPGSSGGHPAGLLGGEKLPPATQALYGEAFLSSGVAGPAKGA